MTVFSFHPVKHITTGEGGMVATNDAKFAEILRRFRNHGIAARRGSVRPPVSGTTRWSCWDSTTACRTSLARWDQQLKKLDENLARRRQIAARYTAAFREIPGSRSPGCGRMRIRRGICIRYGWNSKVDGGSGTDFPRCARRISGSTCITFRSICTLITANISDTRLVNFPWPKTRTHD